MRLIFKLVLTVLFIPLFLMLLAGVSFRYQLLSPLFWQNTFTTSETYLKLSTSINKNLESQTIMEGGKVGDIQILTDLITPENLQDLIGKNINNVLQFANGKAGELIVYVPVNKIPKQLLSKSFGDMKEQMKLTDLLTEFNVSGISPSQIQMISRVGAGAWLFLIVTCLVSILVLYLLYILVVSGKRLVAPGVSLILGGIVSSFVALSGTVIRINWAKDLAGRSNMGDAIIGIVAPPVIQGILSYWIIFSVISIALGMVLIFLRKPYINNKGSKNK